MMKWCKVESYGYKEDVEAFENLNEARAAAQKEFAAVADFMRKYPQIAALDYIMVALCNVEPSGETGWRYAVDERGNEDDTYYEVADYFGCSIDELLKE